MLRNRLLCVLCQTIASLTIVERTITTVLTSACGEETRGTYT